MKSLEKALDTLNVLSIPSYRSSFDPRIRLVVTVVYMVAVLSVPVLDPGRMIWMAIYPILAAEISGVGYARVFVRSLWILPLVALIGAFNPVIDHVPCWQVGSWVISRGWVSLFGVIFRGLLAFQALLVLVMSMGFYDICRSLSALGCPDILTTQLIMIYRYIGVLMQEALTMHRAREARGFGRRSYPLKMWGTFVGELLVRSLGRSRRISDAMDARGFDGCYRWGSRLPAPSAASWAWLVCWIAVFAVLRFVDFTAIVNSLITSHI